MGKDTTLVERGAPVDARAMDGPPEDGPAELVLEPGHPGLGDAGYVARRRELFALCRRHRLEGLGPPIIDYNAGETRLWREVSAGLRGLHERHASRLFLDAKHALGLGESEVPQLREVSERLRAGSGIHLVRAEGLLPYETFYGIIAGRGFPVTQFLRHDSHPEFTPEPDLIHDCLGHVPPLMDRDYADLMTLLGRASGAATTDEQTLALKRFAWFSVEFGLIDEGDGAKVFGAGILSSTGEIPYSLTSPEVTRRPFVTDEVIATDYDLSRMQDRLFVIPSLPFLRRELEGLVRRLGIGVA